MKNNSTLSQLISILLVVQTLFIVMKVNDVLNWVWGWVLSPLWISFSCVALYTVGYILFLFLTEVHKEKWGK